MPSSSASRLAGVLQGRKSLTSHRVSFSEVFSPCSRAGACSGLWSLWIRSADAGSWQHSAMGVPSTTETTSGSGVPAPTCLLWTQQLETAAHPCSRGTLALQKVWQLTGLAGPEKLHAAYSTCLDWLFWTARSSAVALMVFFSKALLFKAE